MADHVRREPPTPQLARLRLWDRQPDEGDVAWRLFVVYRDLGMVRNLREVAEHGGIKRQTVANLSHKHHWRRRIEAYEVHLDGIRQAEHEKSVRELAKLHVGVSQLMMRKAVAKLQQASLDDITLRDAIMMVKAASPLARQAHDADRMFLPPQPPAPRPLAAWQDEDDEDDDHEEAAAPPP